jgi:predicted AAA+ superfamily ATPase
MKSSEIKEVIEDRSRLRANRLGMRRDALDGFVSEDGFATIVTGVRRSGKSTLLDQWVEQQNESVACVHFDDLRMSSFSTSDFSILDVVVREMQMDTLVLDEVQDIPEWERFVNGCLDMGRRVLVTGSNAKMLSRELGTKLTGRHLNVELYPFSFSEFLRFRKMEPSPITLNEYLSTGGFPAYVRTQRREVLEELFNDIIYRDIVVRYHLRDHVPIRSLAAYLLGHVGSRVSPSRLKDAIRVSSASTILEYFSYLEETYLLRRLPRFASSSKAQMSYPKKVYACDTGLVSALSPKDGADFGHKLENLVYLKLLKEGGRLSYFADANDTTECDFIQEHRDGSFSAVQVAWNLSKGNEEREFQGAICAMDRFGIKESVLVTYDQSDLVNINGRIIRVVPAHEFLI